LHPGRRPGRVALTAATVSAAASGFGWVLAVLFSDPAGVAHDPVRGYLWCAGFAVFATVASVFEISSRGKPLSAILVVCSLAMWALLPATAFLAFFAAQVINVFVIVVASPLLLASAAWLLVLRGRVARGTGLLLVAVLVAAGGTALWSPVLPIAAWLPELSWQLALGIAAVAALRQAMRRERSQHQPA
jgi:hypothetical protein